MNYKLLKKNQHDCLSASFSLVISTIFVLSSVNQDSTNIDISENEEIVVLS